MPREVTIRRNTRTSKAEREPHSFVATDAPASAPVTEPAPASAPTQATEKAERVGFFLGDDEASVNWERFKSPSGREKMQTIIQNEAKRMGYVRASAPAVSAPGTVTGAMVFGLVNALVMGAAQPLNLTSEEVAFLQLSDAEQKLLNDDGRVDRLVAKYLGETTFKYADEVMLGVTLVALVNAKVQGIKAIRSRSAGKGATAAATVNTEGERA